MVLFLEVPIAGIALVLSLLSWKTLRKIKHLGVGKSFWIPVLLSGIFFFIGSTAAILNDLDVSFGYIVEFIAFSRLLALCILLGGVSTYSRQISRNLVEKFILPTRPAPAETREETEPPKSIVDRLEEKNSKEESGCTHELGYLKTLPRKTPVPDECLSCSKIIECKHSYLRRTEAKPSASSIPDSGLEFSTTKPAEEEAELEQP